MKFTHVTVTRNRVGNKKYKAVFTDKRTNKKKTVLFGAKGYKDFTLKSKFSSKKEALETRKKYRTRHRGDKKNVPTSPGSLSWYVLWGPSQEVTRNVKTFKRRFGLK